MTRLFPLFVLGLLLATTGLTWALGPWALFGCGVAVVVLALLVDDGEQPRLPEPPPQS